LYTFNAGSDALSQCFYGLSDPDGLTTEESCRNCLFAVLFDCWPVHVFDVFHHVRTIVVYFMTRVSLLSVVCNQNWHRKYHMLLVAADTKYLGTYTYAVASARGHNTKSTMDALYLNLDA
jgi:hypothetical protein